ncbi:MAG: rubrerythrin [Oscillospiraceae bacterium]
MENKNELKITTRDRLLSAWQNSTELVRDFQNYSDDIRDSQCIKKMFAEFAEDEAVHSAKLLEYLHEYEGK